MDIDLGSGHSRLGNYLVRRIAEARHMASTGEAPGEAQSRRFGVTRGPLIVGTSTKHLEA
jgi:hypothetical protein